MTTYNIIRYPLELVACGISKFTGFTDGVPQFSPALTGGETTLKGKIDAAHIATDGICGQSGYLNRDLNSGSAYTALYAAITPAQKRVYQAIQKSAIDSLRRQNANLDDGAFVVFFVAAMEAANIASADFTVAKASWTAVKAQFPYPTSY